MKADDYIVKMDGGVNAADFAAGVGAAEYDIEKSERDGNDHLIYELDGARYDITLDGEENIMKGSSVTIRPADQ
jgi:hypothetical protein